MGMAEWPLCDITLQNMGHSMDLRQQLSAVNAVQQGNGFGSNLLKCTAAIEQ